VDIPYLPLRVVTLVVTFCLSAFFSGSETALFSFDPGELALMGAGKGADLAVARLRERPHRLLVAILFGNMLANVVFYTVSFTMLLAVSDKLPPWGRVLFGFASLLAILTGGEVLPKNLAYTFYRPVARFIARPMLLYVRLAAPLCVPLAWLAGAVSRRGDSDSGEPLLDAEELRLVVMLGAQDGVLDSGTGEMIADVIELADVRVSELMVPRVEMVGFDLNDGADGLLPLFQRAKHTALPVWEGTTENMLGLVHVRDAFLRAADEPVRPLVRPAPFVPATASAEGALRRLRDDGAKTAFVVDEHGTIEGMITVEDLTEAIVGEIHDEFDEDGPPVFEPLDGERHRVRGALSLRDWQELSDIEPPDLGVDTVGGLVMALLDRVPEVGDTVTLGEHLLVVESVDGRRVDTVLVARSLESQGGKRDA